ncbi:hypothetical protein AUEXF2481DRAFT_26654 [Aureobasidium subglaciale EXF-2481]|uniref:F-box domain-containing protein n=1 Tax=Aureobasidium subglaciale (strain EXF-2481) TaxID=1043005 RepID=A0A074YQ34_AURSE|nr:uncharacterized protein AUEXF2481DRAFT_26654 [Aureobasidium subglaciale EXF-2481]KAI5197553.1 hypothetical protein E4T38_07969 [Aureobasidium subglaciale]KAI5216444.1 hypothetical protein E4T40_07979 [Aureobasidium subglaciale]KAI5219608.1 hypothetical protein E4T41_07851 [Aureobasidium subglaciale]KAI5257643.1 hypothetical protein E4T46_07870 [Aureobasidium subglaciale]KEQ98269.1 hypothetical protein AUEXF2481DRAFT_26654 [Aureobasidium subglaciale EXF-2481]
MDTIQQQLTPPPEKSSPTEKALQHHPAISQPAVPSSYSYTQPPMISACSRFDQLPLELLTIIAHDVDIYDHVATKSLRCVSRRSADVCTGLVFRSATLLLRLKSISNLRSLLDNPGLCSVVTQLTIDTAEYTDTCMDTYDWEYRDEELLQSFLAVLRKLGRFRNLRSVTLKCSSECVGPQQRRHWWARNVPESIKFRTDVLQSLFAGLNAGHATPSHLCIENLQGCGNDIVVRSRDFREVMSHVQKLELQITTEDVDGDGSLPANLGKKELHSFFGKQLVSSWLEPVRHNLTHLKLYARDLYFGYLPRCQLPHFPALRSLIIGGMSFSHDEQLRWISTHGNTLEELVLDNCPIVIGVRIPSTLDSDNFPIEPLFNSSTTGSILAPSSFLYPARWHDYFSHFAVELKKLRSIRCGFGDWYDNVAFPKSRELGVGLWAQRYRILDDGEWRRPPFEDGSYDGKWSSPPTYPDCTDEDWIALCEVRTAIDSRVCT